MPVLSIMGNAFAVLRSTAPRLTSRTATTLALVTTLRLVAVPISSLSIRIPRFPQSTTIRSPTSSPWVATQKEPTVGPLSGSKTSSVRAVLPWSNASMPARLAVIPLLVLSMQLNASVV